MNRVKIRSAVLRLAPLFLAVVLTLIFTSVALAALHGPVTTPPGGVTITPSDPSGRQIGLAGGINYVFSNFQLDQFETLYWGGPQGTGAAGFAFDGAIDGPEIMTFNPGQSNLPNGMAMWTGQSVLTWWVGSGWATNSYPTRFTLRVTDPAGNPIPMVIASSVGIPGPGPVITVTGNFTANLLMEFQYSGWQPCLAVYNALNTPSSGSVRSSFWYQFYYTTAGNATITKEVTPSYAAPGDLITYTLSFSNTGTEILTGLVITDIVPVSITVQSIISSGVAITDTGAPTPYVWTVADLGIGQSGVITISGILTTPLAAGAFTNTVTVTATNDTTEANNSSSIPLTVTNVAPVAADDIYTAIEDIPLVVPAATGLLDNDDDANGDPLTAGLLTAPLTGTVDLAASGAYTYTPELNFNGVVTFTYYADDGLAVSPPAVVTITVRPVCDCAVELEPPAAAQTGDTGTTVTYTLRVTNTGDCADMLDVTVNALWATGAPATVGPLASGEGRDVVVTVAIPAGADEGDQDVATITFTSQGAGTVSAATMLTTTANVPTYRVYLPLVLRGAQFGGVRGEPGRVAIYPE